MPRRRTAALLACSTLALAACGAPGGSQDSGTGAVRTVVGFYPLAYAVQRVGGDRVEVTDLTRPGAEPHDVELTPHDVATVSGARLAVYEKAIQPQVDAAVTSENVPHRVEVGQVAGLDAVVDRPVLDVSDPEAQAEHSAGDGHDHGPQAGSVDPHFWLDPVRYQKVVRAVAEQLVAIDPAGKAQYEKNAAALAADLTALDEDYRTRLKTCRSRTLVTSHAAFGYLASRYDMKQASISGLSPEQEPQPQRLAQIADFVRANGVGTVYAETLTDPALARTVAAETGAQMAVLDPIEGITKPGTDYLSLMRSNLDTLTTGQGCK